ncbi:carboxylesterase family protein [Gimesia fumaroli]|uniref:Phospholipase/Carboxylesterase n=1 Tax=Gimesia fumaroli TaxID=2527976 RepID=A0A518IDT5_9PLAN|nr:dienelactone hydrolase family protein [Gimesia fumaroli]QDV51248.1 Phospholipase/Carboxylesterase [Gimesia fumaroli]
MTRSVSDNTHVSDHNSSNLDFRFLLICVSVQILVNLLILPFIWDENQGHARRKQRYISPEVIAQYARGQVLLEVPEGQSSLHYRLMKPRMSSVDTKYPLVIFLHGAGSRGDDNRIPLGSLPTQLSRKAWREKYPCYVLVPQCPRERWWGQFEMVELLYAALDKTLNENESIDRSRIYLIGLSMGGNGCWSFAAYKPEIFAGVAPFCGQGDPATASLLKEIPFWVVHGDADRVIDVSYSREMVEALQKENGNIIYHELPGVGHNCWGEAFREPSEMMDWMFQQQKKIAK